MTDADVERHLQGVVAEPALPVARTDIATFGAQQVRVVERFDRQWATWADHGAPWIARLPQGDFCQVRGLPSSTQAAPQGMPRLARSVSSLMCFRK